MLGRRFCPRIRSVQHQRLYRIDRDRDYGILTDLVASSPTEGCYSEVQFALPKELNEDERREAASCFAERLTGGERLPYTLAIHRGGPNGENPHAHLMFSERGHDGIERDTEQWFKRYNAEGPGKGPGGRKSRVSKAGEGISHWIASIRPSRSSTCPTASGATLPMLTVRLTRLFRADRLLIAGSFCYRYETSSEGFPVSKRNDLEPVLFQTSGQSRRAWT